MCIFHMQCQLAGNYVASDEYQSDIQVCTHWCIFVAPVSPSYENMASKLTFPDKKSCIGAGGRIWYLVIVLSNGCCCCFGAWFTFQWLNLKSLQAKWSQLASALNCVSTRNALVMRNKWFYDEHALHILNNIEQKSQTLSPWKGTLSHWAMSFTFGIVALTAINRTFAIGICCTQWLSTRISLILPGRVICGGCMQDPEPCKSQLNSEWSRQWVFAQLQAMPFCILDVNVVCQG